MMATQLLYRAAGCPDVDGVVPAQGECWLCGGDLAGAGVPWARWIKPTFTDHDKAARPDCSYLCAGCVFAAEERSAALQARLGRDKPASMRNYSHFVVAGAWEPLSKGDKRRMRELLPRAELAVIAVSGQKHLVCRAMPGWWQFEEHTMWRDWPELEARLGVVEALYETFSKAEIDRGDYAMHRIARFGLGRFRELEAQVRRWRGSVVTELALFLAQRSDDGLGGTGGEDSVAGAPEHGLERLGLQAAQILADTDRQRAGGGLHQQPEPVRQLSLLPDAGAGARAKQGRPRRG